MNDMDSTMSRPPEGLDQLPGEMAPDQDLWPAISARLPERTDAARTGGRRGWAPGAIAASVAVAFLAGILLGRQVQNDVPPSDSLSIAEYGAPALNAALQAVELEYAASYKGFMPFLLEPVEMDGQTTDDLRASWAAMQEAELALKTALEEHPDNPFLGSKLLSLRAQQLEFMRQIHMLDQNSWRNT